MTIGRTVWAIPEGYIPAWSHGPAPELLSHEAFCVLNTNDQEAALEVTIYFSDADPSPLYRFTVPARRTRHFRFNDFQPPIPLGQDFASTITSSVPVVIQHTRLDSRQSENALMTTIAYAE